MLVCNGGTNARSRNGGYDMNDLLQDVIDGEVSCICGVCNGLGQILGCLGRRICFRCRDCGSILYREVTQ